MSRGCVRTALKNRLQEVAESWQLPYKESVDNALKKPEVYEQFAPVNDDELSIAPCIFASVGKVTQKDGERTGIVTIGALIYAADSEQGYRDSENLVEDIETQLISNPWLGNGGKLTGPWVTDLSESAFPVFQAILTCSVQMPAVECLIGPDGQPLEV